MYSATLLSISLLLTTSASQTLPTQGQPLRNTFVVAVETVVDEAGKIDLKATGSMTDAQLQQLQAAKQNLVGMPEDDREKDVVTTTNDMVFAVTACHLQATNGADTTNCHAQFVRARTRVMEAIGKHKVGDTWLDGPPA